MDLEGIDVLHDEICVSVSEKDENRPAFELRKNLSTQEIDHEETDSTDTISGLKITGSHKLKTKVESEGNFRI